MKRNVARRLNFEKKSEIDKGEEVTIPGLENMSLLTPCKKQTSIDEDFKQKLYQSFALGLSSTSMQHFPDLPLGNDQYVSASWNLTSGKSNFYFRTGRTIENNPRIIQISDNDMIALMNYAPIFIRFYENWDEINTHAAENRALSDCKTDFPADPAAVLIHDDDLFQVWLKVNSESGIGVTLHKHSKGKNKPLVAAFDMHGESLKHLLTIHIPFFRSVYDEIKTMIERVAVKVGLTSTDVIEATSWKFV